MPIDPTRLQRCYAAARATLLAERSADGHWVGELSTSALSTATAVMALEMIRRDRRQRPSSSSREEDVSLDRLSELIEGGLRWLADHANDDGGWGDTTKSLSNISTTMLAHAVFHATGTTERYGETVAAAQDYIDRVGGVDAVLKRYGKDKTFSIPILTHCALAGLVDWNDVQPLPFELACLPPQFYKTVRLPVVSYALPALIAIGQVRHHHRKPWFLPWRWVRDLARQPSLRVLQRIQPSSGGFLEAAPLTSFVTMSLAGMGLADHPVARSGLDFLVKSVRPDGSWPIDTNLATWVTTLSVNTLENDLPDDARTPILNWLLGQQYTEVHPYTNADPGGWAWTDLPGGVPDADDTPGAILAVLRLARDGRGEVDRASREACANAIGWLLDLQNRDGGFPTFCRGWGKLPFDRSSADITAHCIRALVEWMGGLPPEGVRLRLGPNTPRHYFRSYRAVWKAFRFLERVQRTDGSWLPLWFGNQYGRDDENPTYGTARVLAAYRDCGLIDTAPARRGLQWLIDNQNGDGGWGGAKGIPSSVEESALATEILVSVRPESAAAERGVAWLLDRVEDGSFTDPTPIGFYFAKLWYFEKIYPLTFMVSALGRARRAFGSSDVPAELDEHQDSHHPAAVDG